MIHVLTSCIETKYMQVHTSIYFHTNVHQALIKVYIVIYLYVHLRKGHNPFSLQIRPYPNCDAGEFPKHA
jgi:hypothetical protein